VPTEMLGTAESFYGRHGPQGTPLAELAARGLEIPPAGLVLRHWHGQQGRVRVFLPTAVDLAAPPAPVRVYRGMWIVDCPTCGGAQVAAAGDHRLLCVDCYNADIGGRWRQVTWPADAAQIERVLLARPDLETRNWTTETVAELQAENLQRGLPSEADA
jgi:hypothetical protein